MANNLGSLVVSLGLDAAEFTRGMSKSEYEAKKTTDRIKSQFNDLVKFTAGLGAGAMFANFVRNTAAAGEEVQRLSALVNASTERFQAEAYAAQRAGVSQEKYADILKDVQDKVGDFLQTGGGPMKDFFENIAPKVGVTAEQFRKLSGPEALQLYVSSLEKANLSQSDLTFYMEAIASDSTLLLPLLRDNGKAMGELAKEAKDLGIVLDDEAVKSAKKFNDELTRMETAAAGFGRKVALPIIEGLNHVIDQYRLARQYSDGWYEALFRTGTSNPAERIQDITEKIKGLNKELESPSLVGLPRARVEDAIKAGEKDLALLRAFQRSEQLADNARLAGQFGKDSPKLNSLAARNQVFVPPTKPEEKGKTTSKVDRSAEAYDAWMRSIAKGEEDYRQSLFASRLEAQEALEKQYQADLLQYEADKDASNQRMFLERLQAQEKERMDSAERVREQAEKAAEAQQLQAQKLGDAFSSTFDRAFTDGMKLGDLLKKLAYDAINIQFLTPATQKIGSTLGTAVSSLFSFDGGGYTGSGARSGGLDGKGGFMAVLHPNETVVDHSRGQGGGSAGGTTIVQNISIDARGADASVDQKIRAAMSQTKAETLAAVQAKANRGGSFAASMGRA